MISLETPWHEPIALIPLGDSHLWSHFSSSAQGSVNLCEFFPCLGRGGARAAAPAVLIAGSGAAGADKGIAPCPALAEPLTCTAGTRHTPAAPEIWGLQKVSKSIPQSCRVWWICAALNSQADIAITSASSAGCQLLAQLGMTRNGLGGLCVYCFSAASISWH